jgi:hypothetical protein
MKITQIVPRFRPQIDGLGDYARLLGERLAAECGINSDYVVGDLAWSGDGGEMVRAVKQQTAGALLEALGDCETVVLHYVGYGYHNRGIPFWINRAIRQWKCGGKERRLVVIFHELWASGPPWKSEFYLGWIQRNLVRELHELADVSVASVPFAHRSLEALRRKPLILHPVPSNIGSSDNLARHWHESGSLRVALFGMPSQRLVSLRRHLRLVSELHQAGLLRHVRVIGKDVRTGDDPSSDIQLLRTVVPEERILTDSNADFERAGQALAESDILLSFYPSRWLFKSGSAMAALANGAVPVLPEENDLEILSAGHEILVCSGDDASLARFLARVGQPGGIGGIGRAGYDWYWRNADWPILAQKLTAALERLTDFGAPKNDKSRLATVGGTPLIPTQGRMEK